MVQLRTFRGVHESRVGSLTWNNSILTSGKDGKIVNNDVRVRSHVIQTYQGHEEEVCGLKWSSSGQLASGGNGNSLYIRDLFAASSHPLNQNQWLHRFEDHTSSVKALAWCPFQRTCLHLVEVTMIAASSSGILTLELVWSPCIPALKYDPFFGIRTRENC